MSTDGTRSGQRVKQLAGRSAAIALVALMLCWPAFCNGYPLLFPDSLEYLGAGHGITLVLRGKYAPTWMFFSIRSEMYAAGIFLLDHQVTLWPVAAAQALLTAWVVWLVVRSVCARLPWVWRRRNASEQRIRMLALAAVVLFVVPANAFLAGVVSTVAPRYQGRLVWLVALLAGLMVAMYLDRSRQRYV